MATEKRLIDANALFPGRILAVNIKDPMKTVDYLMNKINNAPTVDAVEVVHSQWDTVFYDRNGTLASYSHLCPVCKYFYRDVKFKGHNYCPNCGAKMDGDGNG